MKSLRLVLATLCAATLLSACGHAPLAASAGATAATGSVSAASIFHFLPKNRELTETERHLAFDGIRALATSAAVAWNPKARLIVGGSHSVDETATRTITSGYIFVFHVGFISRLYVKVEGNQLTFARCRFPLPLSLSPLLPWGKQLVAGDHIGAADAIAAAKVALHVSPKSYKIWLLEPNGYADPVYYVTADQFLGLGKTAIVNASTGKIVDTKVLPFGIEDKIGGSLKSLDAVQMVPLDAPEESADAILSN